MTRDLPRNVYKNGKHYMAMVHYQGKKVYLGTHKTPEDAEDAVREYRKIYPARGYQKV